jgi:hypothetical protein
MARRRSVKPNWVRQAMNATKKVNGACLAADAIVRSWSVHNYLGKQREDGAGLD